MSSSASFSAIYGLANLTAPASGVTHSAKWALLLTGGIPATLNMLSQMEFLGDFLGQAMTLDNTQNTSPVVIQETTYGWTRTVQAGELRTFQYPGCPNQNFVFTCASNATAILSVYDWPAFPDSDFELTNVSGTPVTVLGTVQTQDAIAESYLADLQPGVALTSRSIALAGTGASIQLMAANAARKTMFIAPIWSPGSGTTDTWINMLGGAAAVGGLDSLNLNPATVASGIFANYTHYVSTSSVHVWDDASFATGGPYNLTAWEG